MSLYLTLFTNIKLSYSSLYFTSNYYYGISSAFLFKLLGIDIIGLLLIIQPNQKKVKSISLFFVC